MGPEQNSSLARFKLLVQAGPRVGEVILIDRSVLRVGRQLTNDLVISDAKVSRQHARLELQDDGLLLTDEGSSNGTYVNGIRIDGPTLLQVGDVVAFGASHLLVQAIPVTAATAGVAPPAAPAPIDERPVRAAPEPEYHAVPSAPTAATPPGAARDRAEAPANPPTAASPSARTVIGPSPAAAPPSVEVAVPTPVPPSPAPPPAAEAPAAPAASLPPVATPDDAGGPPPADAARPAREGFLQRLLAVFKRRA